MEETWKDIKGYEGLYQVSSLGNIRSLPREWITGTGGIRRHNGKILSQTLSRGYSHVTLYLNGSKKVFFVHVLVAVAFLNHTPNGHEIVVDHINNNKLDNKVDNLQLITHRENTIKDWKGNTSKHTGVSLLKVKRKNKNGTMKQYKYWQAQLTFKGERIHLGTFKTEAEAAEAYNNKIKSLY